ncbi:unnamed protein product, partial [Ectocarpus sp. 12 AP-2014]
MLSKVKGEEPKEGSLAHPKRMESIEDYLQEAGRAKACLDKLVESVAPSGTRGREGIPAAIKSLESTRRKADKTTGGIHCVTDLARSTIVCDTPQDLVDVFESICSSVNQIQGGGIRRVFNGFVRHYAKNGYRDVKVNVVLAEHVCEMQLHLRSFYDRLKDGQHKVYEWSRTLNVTVDMKAEHLFKNMDRKTLAIMTRLAGDDWQSTGSA